MLTWIILRAAGIAAYLLLWATVAWGLIGTTSLGGKRIARATAINVHQFLATAAFVMLGVHIGGLLVDQFARCTCWPSRRSQWLSSTACSPEPTPCAPGCGGATWQPAARCCS
jgi:hypothetical protein